MEIKTIEAEGLAAAHFVDEGRPGLLEPFALGMSQVDQVTVVRQDAPGRVTPARQFSPKAAIWAGVVGGALH